MRSYREKPKTLRATLLSIRDLIVRRWMKGDFTDGHGRYCLLGAIEHVDGSYEDKARVMLRSTVKKITGEGFIAQFNDDPDTKRKDVLAVIDQTLARVRGGV